jgi:hypothetical protein
MLDSLREMTYSDFGEVEYCTDEAVDRADVIWNSGNTGRQRASQPFLIS